MSKAGILTTEPGREATPFSTPESRCAFKPRHVYGRPAIGNAADKSYDEQGHQESARLAGLLRLPSRALQGTSTVFLGHDFNTDFSRVPVRSNAGQLETATRADFGKVNYQTPPVSPPVVPSAPPAAATPTVNAITLVTGPTGATSGFGAILGNSDLNVPGPFNHAPTGEVTNVHQIKFHLDQGSSAAVTPVRIVRATFNAGGAQSRYPADMPGDPGGIGGTRTHPDGPPPHEIQKPSGDTVVVADAPGRRSLSASQYPFSLAADFTLTLAAGATPIARITYEVRITKTNATNIPNTQNSVTATDKTDLVRGRSLA